MTGETIEGGNADRVMARATELTWGLAMRHWTGAPRDDDPALDDRGLRVFWLRLFDPDFGPAEIGTPDSLARRRKRHARRVLTIPLELLHPGMARQRGRDTRMPREEEYFEQQQLDIWIGLMARRLRLPNAKAVPPRMMACLATFIEGGRNAVATGRDSRPPYPPGFRPPGAADWSRLADRIEKETGADAQPRQPYSWYLSRPGDKASARLPADLGLADIAGPFIGLIPAASRDLVHDEIALARDIERGIRIAKAAKEGKLTAEERARLDEETGDLKRRYQSQRARSGEMAVHDAAADPADDDIFAWPEWAASELKKFPAYAAYRHLARVMETLNDPYAKCYAARLDPSLAFDFEDGGNGIGPRYIDGKIPIDKLKLLARIEQAVDRERLEQAIKPALEAALDALSRAIGNPAHAKSLARDRRLVIDPVIRKRLSQTGSAERKAWELLARTLASLDAIAGPAAWPEQDLTACLKTVRDGLPASASFELEDMTRLRDAPFWSSLLQRVRLEGIHYPQAWDRLPVKDRTDQAWLDFQAEFNADYRVSLNRAADRPSFTASLESVDRKMGLAPEQDRVGEPPDPRDMIDVDDIIGALCHFRPYVIIESPPNIPAAREQLAAIWQRGPRKSGQAGAAVLTKAARNLIERTTFTQIETMFKAAAGRELLTVEFLRAYALLHPERQG